MNFIEEYNKLKLNGFPFKETIELGFALGNSENIEAHFKIYCQNEALPKDQRALGISESFDKHGNAGAGYLFSQLSEHEEIAIHAAYLLSSLMIHAKHLIQPGWHNELVQRLMQLTESNMPEIRRKSLIALGWVGTDETLPVIKDHLLNDTDDLSRAWSASAFLQMAFWGHVTRHELEAIAKSALTECISNESDLFVKGVAIEAVQDIWNIKLGLRQSAVENRKERSINNAAKRALIYLNQG